MTVDEFTRDSVILKWFAEDDHWSVVFLVAFVALVLFFYGDHKGWW